MNNSTLKTFILTAFFLVNSIDCLEVMNTSRPKRKITAPRRDDFSYDSDFDADDEYEQDSEVSDAELLLNITNLVYTREMEEDDSSWCESPSSSSGYSDYQSEDDEDQMHIAKKRKVSIKADGEYQCDECSQTFTRNSNLTRHKRIHAAIKRFQCPVDSCGKRFQEKHHLAAHLRTHTGEKPFECPKCNRRFNDSGNCQRHSRETHR